MCVLIDSVCVLSAASSSSSFGGVASLTNRSSLPRVSSRHQPTATDGPPLADHVEVGSMMRLRSLTSDDGRKDPSTSADDGREDPSTSAPIHLCPREYMCRRSAVCLLPPPTASTPCHSDAHRPPRPPCVIPTPCRARPLRSPPALEHVVRVRGRARDDRGRARRARGRALGRPQPGDQGRRSPPSQPSSQHSPLLGSANCHHSRSTAAYRRETSRRPRDRRVVCLPACRSFAPPVDQWGWRRLVLPSRTDGVTERHLVCS